MLISIVIPCFNVADYIRECIESVINQAYESLEVICVDNNSTDDTKEVLSQLKEIYPQLIITSEAKKGAGAARNKGLSLVKGEWVQFLDADDILLPEKIYHQYNLIKDKSQVGFVAGSYFRQFTNGKENKIFVKPMKDWCALAGNKLGITSSNLYNKTALNKVGNWNEALKSSQESELMFRLLKKDEKVIYDEAPLTIVRDRQVGSISHTNLVENLLRYINLRTEILAHLHTLPNMDDEKEMVVQVLFDKIRELYNFDQKSSLLLYKQLIPTDFHPVSTAGTTSNYLLIYKLFGFRLAQKIKGLLK